MQRTERSFQRRLCKDDKRVQQEQDVSQRDMFHGLLRHAAFEALGVSKTAAVTFAQLEHAAVTTAVPVMRDESADASCRSARREGLGVEVERYWKRVQNATKSAAFALLPL
jgi:hypothetical protein